MGTGQPRLPRQRREERRREEQPEEGLEPLHTVTLSAVIDQCLAPICPGHAALVKASGRGTLLVSRAALSGVRARRGQMSSIHGWDNFFVAEAGAAAALSGLVFVAV